MDLLALAAEHGLPVLFPAIAAWTLWQDNKLLRQERNDLERANTDFLKSLLSEAE